MSTMPDNPTSPAALELVVTRVFDAPRELVFKAWTTPDLMAKWWGPAMFTNPVCQLDARPGGALRIEMRAPNGTVYPMTGVFHEVVAPARLVFTSRALEDKHGKAHLEVLNTVTFAERGDTTQLTLRASVVKSTPAAATALAGMEEGWNQSLDSLAVFVSPTVV